MSCPRRRCVGSGFQKPTDPALSAANDTALNALLAKRAEHDARLAGFWKAAGEPKPETKSSTPGADVVEVDGHHYRFDNPGNAEKVQADLSKLLADRGYQNTGISSIVPSSVGTAVPHHYFATTAPPITEAITHVGGGFRRAAPASSMRPRASEPAGAAGRLTTR
jgi:hypothetical protein